MFNHPLVRRLFVGVAAVTLARSLAATDRIGGAGVEQLYRVSHWTTEQGLPQNRIACMAQTTDGYLWLGTWFGLARFDGVRFTVFDKFNTPELVTDAISALAADTDGALWIGTPGGLLRYREHRFQRVSAVEGLPNRHVPHLAASRMGGVWLEAGGLVALLRGGKLSRTWNTVQAAWQKVLSLKETADGSLSIVMSDAWLTLSPQADDLRTNLTAAPASAYWLCGLPTGPGSLVVAATNGIHRWEQGAWTVVGNEKSGPNALDFMFNDRSGNFWANARPGELYRWDGKRWMCIDLGDHFSPAATVCMEQDREGNLWVGTERGLVELQARRVHAYTARDGLADDNVWSVCEGTDGTIWVGGNGGLNRIQNGRVAPIHELEPAASEHDSDRCVWPRHAGGVWIAKSVGVIEFQDAFTQRLEASALPDSVSALYEDRLSRLWIGTGRGVFVFQDGGVTATYTNWAGQSKYNVRCILEDRAGNFWFGAQGQGLTRLQKGKFVVFTTRNGLSSDHVWSIHEDAEGALWLGTENGLNRYRQGRFFPFTRQHGLLENSVNWILEDDFGYLWLSGLRGIYRIKLEQLNDVAEGRARLVECAAFGTADGMESSETNGESQPAGWKTRDGRLWFPTGRGVVVIDPKMIAANEVPPPVVIERVKADGLVIFGDWAVASASHTTSNPEAELKAGNDATGPSKPQARMRLGAGRARVVQFDYTANTFVDPKRARFRYRLVNHDRDWREETAERVAHYTALHPGDYRFEVIAANHQGVWNTQPETFAFSLAPHYYETWPFYLLCAVGVIGTAAGLQAYRLRWQHRLLKLDEQRALANERTRIARDLHDDLGTALTGLALELDVLRRDVHDAPTVTERLGQTAQRTRELAEQMREVVWTVNPRCDTVSSLASFLEQQVEQFLRVAGVQVRLEFPEDIPALPVDADTRHQLALSVREALTNVIRHAKATQAVVGLSIDGQTLIIRVADNGCGFHPAASTGHGLANLRARLERIGGHFDCDSAPGQGTTLRFRVPLQTPGPDQRSSS